jgi:hypothetical protein
MSHLPPPARQTSTTTQHTQDNKVRQSACEYNVDTGADHPEANIAPRALDEPTQSKLPRQCATVNRCIDYVKLCSTTNTHHVADLKGSIEVPTTGVGSRSHLAFEITPFPLHALP